MQVTMIGDFMYFILRNLTVIYVFMLILLSLLYDTTTMLLCSVYSNFLFVLSHILTLLV